MLNDLVTNKLKNDDDFFINTTLNIYGSSLNSDYRLAGYSKQSLQLHQ